MDCLMCQQNRSGKHSRQSPPPVYAVRKETMGCSHPALCFILNLVYQFLRITSASLNDICPSTFNVAVMSFRCKVLVKLQFQISRDPARWGAVQQISSTLRCQEFQDKLDTQNSPFYITPRTHTHQEREGTPPLSITRIYKRERDIKRERVCVCVCVCV